MACDSILEDPMHGKRKKSIALFSLELRGSLLRSVRGGSAKYFELQNGDRHGKRDAKCVKKRGGWEPPARKWMKSEQRVSRAAALISVLVAFFPIGDVANGQNGSAIELAVPDNVGGAARSVTPIDLLKLRTVGGMTGRGLSLSPDGRSVAFELHRADSVENRYHVAWFIAPIAVGARARNVGDGGDASLFMARDTYGAVNGAWISEYAKWSPDGTSILYRKKVNGEIQVWSSNSDGRVAKQLTQSSGDIHAFYWSSDGRKLFLETGLPRNTLKGIEDARARTGYLFDPTQRWSSFHGKPLRPMYEQTGGKPLIWVLDVESGTQRKISSEEMAEYQRVAGDVSRSMRSGSVRALTWSPRRTVSAWFEPTHAQQSGIDPPLTLVGSKSTHGATPVRCPAEVCTGRMDTRVIRNRIWVDDSGEIFFVRREGPAYFTRSLYRWRIGEEDVEKILSTDDWLSDCSRTLNLAICFEQSAIRPRVIVSIDLDDGVKRTIVNVNPEFEELRIGSAKKIEWTNTLGHQTVGYLFKPPEYEPMVRYPMVIVGYRARRSLGGTGNEYPIHVLAANGFVVLVYERPEHWDALTVARDGVELGVYEWGSDMFDYRMPLSSFESVITRLTKEGVIDPDRVALTGFSNGVGHVSYAIIHSSKFAAASVSGLYSSVTGYFLNGADAEFRRRLLHRIGAGRPGGTFDDIDRRRSISLSLNARCITTPILVNSSDTEHLYALEDVITLNEWGRPIEMHVFPNEYHVKWQPAHRLAVYERNVDWFNFWLRDVEDSAEDKQDQYERWRRFRGNHHAEGNYGC